MFEGCVLRSVIGGVVIVLIIIFAIEVVSGGIFLNLFLRETRLLAATPIFTFFYIHIRLIIC